MIGGKLQQLYPLGEEWSLDGPHVLRAATRRLDEYVAKDLDPHVSTFIEQLEDSMAIVAEDAIIMYVACALYIIYNAQAAPIGVHARSHARAHVVVVAQCGWEPL